jgi:hypothetical protein
MVPCQTAEKWRDANAATDRRIVQAAGQDGTAARTGKAFA